MRVPTEHRRSRAAARESRSQPIEGALPICGPAKAYDRTSSSPDQGICPARQRRGLAAETGGAKDRFAACRQPSPAGRRRFAGRPGKSSGGQPFSSGFRPGETDIPPQDRHSGLEADIPACRKRGQPGCRSRMPSASSWPPSTSSRPGAPEPAFPVVPEGPRTLSALHPADAARGDNRTNGRRQPARLAPSQAVGGNRSGCRASISSRPWPPLQAFPECLRTLSALHPADAAAEKTARTVAASPPDWPRAKPLAETEAAVVTTFRAALGRRAGIF